MARAVPRTEEAPVVLGLVPAAVKEPVAAPVHYGPAVTRENALKHGGGDTVAATRTVPWSERQQTQAGCDRRGAHHDKRAQTAKPPVNARPRASL